MRRYFLTQIAIEGFRGINNNGDPLTLSFKPECVNSIYANNGVGKTSIFEALQFAIHGGIPRLAALQDAEQGDSYIVNRFHPAKTATIDLKLSPDDGSADVTIRIVRDANGNRAVTSPSGHATPVDVLHALREDFVLVDYKTFAGFIDNSALLRGRSFSALIGLSQYSNLRQAIEGANNTATLRNDLGIKVLSANIGEHKASVAKTERKIIEAYTDLTGQTLDQIDDRATLESTVTQVLTDMPGEIGGSGDQVTPGWLFRAGLASCAATRIAMGAAAAGFELTMLEVHASSRSDTRGLLGMADEAGAPFCAGPTDMQLHIRIAATSASPAQLRALVEDSQRCAPISAAVQLPVPVAVHIDVVTQSS